MSEQFVKRFSGGKGGSAEPPDNLVQFLTLPETGIKQFWT